MNIRTSRNCASRTGFAVVLVVCMLAMAGCRAPETTRSAPASSPVASTAIELDRNCQADADCTVKNVGNCCGYYPSCVNVDSPVDPEGVKAQCAKTGMASVCGFPAISSCQCVSGKCESSNQLLPD